MNLADKDNHFAREYLHGKYIKNLSFHTIAHAGMRVEVKLVTIDPAKPPMNQDHDSRTIVIYG